MWSCRSVLTAAALALVFAGAGCASSGRQKSAQSEAERYLRLGYVQFERGQTQEAMASANAAIDRDPDNADARNFLGLIYMYQSEFAQAAEHFRAAVKINPYFTDARNNLGVVYREMKQFDRALAEFQAALKDKTYRTPEKIWLNLGRLYLDQGVMSEAVRSYEQAVAINPDYLRGHLDLGEAYLAIGREDRAAAEFRKVMQMAPESPEAERARQKLDPGARRSGS